MICYLPQRPSGSTPQPLSRVEVEVGAGAQRPSGSALQPLSRVEVELGAGAQRPLGSTLQPFLVQRRERASQAWSRRVVTGLSALRGLCRAPRALAAKAPPGAAARYTRNRATVIRRRVRMTRLHGKRSGATPMAARAALRQRCTQRQ